MMRALVAEFAKLKHSRVVLWTGLSAVVYMGLDWALGSYVYSNGGMAKIEEAGGVFAQAVQTGLYERTWANGLATTPQMIAGGLALFLFAFVTAYMFGREYKEGTAWVAFTAPVRREYIVLSKLIVLGVWIFTLALLWLTVHVVDLAIMGFDGFAWRLVFETLGDTFLATFVLYVTMPVFACFAVWGRGYLWPMLAVLTLNGQGMGMLASDGSRYYPWNMPAHLFGASWYPISPSPLVTGSWVVLAAVCVLGIVGTMWRVNHADVSL